MSQSRHRGPVQSFRTLNRVRQLSNGRVSNNQITQSSGNGVLDRMSTVSFIHGQLERCGVQRRQFSQVTLQSVINKTTQVRKRSETTTPPVASRRIYGRVAQFRRAGQEGQRCT